MSLEDDGGRAALRARAHPLRLQMLSLLTGAPMSAAELGRELGVSQALASYHLRCLVEAGVVDLAEEVVNRGGRERRYRHHVGGSEATRADPDSHELILTAVVEELRRRHAQRVPSGPGLTIDAELWVTEQDWLAFRDTVRAAGVRLHEQAARPHTAGTRHVNVSAVLFEMES